MQHNDPPSVGLELGETEVGAATWSVDVTGLSLFFIDQPVVDANLLDKIAARLETKGLDVVGSWLLDADGPQSELLNLRLGAMEVRGFRIGALVATLNLEPSPPTATTIFRRRGVIDDDRAHQVESQLNLLLPLELDKKSTSPAVLLCGDSSRAWALLSEVLPDRVAGVREEIERRRESYRTPFPVIRRLDSGGERAKVEIVDYGGTPAVCKVFRVGREKYFEAELVARRDLSRQIEEMAAILEYGPNWIVSPLYDNTFTFNRYPFRLLSLDRAKQVVNVLEKLYHAGYAHMDMSLKNVVFDRTAGMKVVDSEYLHRYDDPPPTFEESYDVVGPPESYSGDRPIVRGGHPCVYSTKLEPYIGLSLGSLRSDPRWLQHVKRAAYTVVTLLPRSLAGRARTAFRRGRSRFYGWRNLL
jgi:hypothetical protein